ncbi:MAG: hypothetical protein LBN98_07250 [Prevotellaceae bacterium]|jgi:hypothetical protein|nr:hypothetical protein [Prevotellaceae bacterium]
MKRVVKIIVWCLAVLAGLPVAALVVTQAWFYASCPVYRFGEPQPFSGAAFYNPYAGLDAGQWKKAIFHLHTKSWGGLTDGENDRDTVVGAYRSLGYDVVAISNYMHVDTAGASLPGYIPCYEHGYGYGKTHQLPMGSDGKVLWRDYVFVQDIHQKQYTIDLLKRRCEVLALNHPGLRKGYAPGDFKYLSGYHLVEILNTWHTWTEHWDTALSNGHSVWLTANDDAHTVTDLERVQQCAVFIHAPTAGRGDILSGIRRGAAFGVRFPVTAGQTWGEKRAVAAEVSFPAGIAVRNDTLSVTWGRRMSVITFTGDGGKVLATAADTSSAVYVIRPEDTYVRVTLEDGGGLVYYLNPVVRSAGGLPPARQRPAEMDAGATLRKRLIIAGGGLLVSVAAVAACCRKRRSGGHLLYK